MPLRAARTAARSASKNRAETKIGISSKTCLNRFDVNDNEVSNKYRRYGGRITNTAYAISLLPSRVVGKNSAMIYGTSDVMINV